MSENTADYDAHEAWVAARSAESDVTRQDGEGMTAFSVRRIQHDAWVAGHDAACPISLHPCWPHPSPFSDGAYLCVTPPAETDGAS